MGSSYTWDEVRQHTSPGDLWLVIDRKIYDVSRWMDEHPGGPEILLQEAGKDATNAFADIDHSRQVKHVCGFCLSSMLPSISATGGAMRAARPGLWLTCARGSSRRRRGHVGDRGLEAARSRAP